MKHMLLQFLSKVLIVAGYLSLLMVAAQSEEPQRENDLTPNIHMLYETSRTLN